MGNDDDSRQDDHEDAMSDDVSGDEGEDVPGGEDVPQVPPVPRDQPANRQGRGRGRGRGRGQARMGARRRNQTPEEWRWEKCRDMFVPKDIPFTSEGKINVELPDSPNEWDFFNLYLTDDIIEVTVRETNRYAQQYKDDHAETLKDHSNVHNWHPTNYNEMKTFLAMLILMGIIHKPRINMYWTLDSVLETPIFGQIMTRNRFLLLSKFLHFANNDEYDATDPQRDRLYKIREVCELFRQQWKRVFTPGKHLCIDESLVLFKGRLAFKQYIRTKRSRFGVKFYTLSTDSGITLDNLIYCGSLDAELDEGEGFLTTERIPMTLMNDYLDDGRVLYMDNFYTTPRLAKYFLDRGTHTCGTVRTNRRNFPRELARAEIAKGTSMFYTCKDILVVKYRANKDKSDGKPKVVHVLSTKDTNVMAATKKKDRAGEVIKKPKSVIDYNLHMGGIDKIDQQLHQLNVLRKTYKWYRKIFLRLTLQSALNSHKLYALNGGTQDFLGFLVNTVTIMFHSTPRLMRNPRHATQDNLFRLSGHEHFPMRRPVEEGSASANAKHKYKRKTCKVCVAKGIIDTKSSAIRAQYVCKNCPDQPGLHLDGCWEEYHSKLDYSK
jgi:hypothetical protein